MSTAAIPPADEVAHLSRFVQARTLIGSLLRTQKRTFAVAVSGAAVFAACTVGSAMVVRWVIDRVITPRFRDGHVGVGVSVAVLGTVVVLALVRATGVVVRRTWALGKGNFWRAFGTILGVLIPFIVGKPIGAELSAMITFTVFEAAYYSEIMRAGIQSVSRGQVNAGYALGLTYGQSMRLIVLPQAFRNMLPILLTQSIILFQDVSLVSLLNVTDFVGAAVKVAQRDSRVVEMYLFVAVVYFVLCFTLSAAVRQLQRRIAIIR